MDKSKHYNDILGLGKLMVKELSLEPTDTLGRWMVHHISKLITEVEKSSDSQKQETEERCRNAILALWKHIDVFPRNHRPLENIEPLIATIEALSPENKAYFFQSEAMAMIKESTLPEESKSWLDLAHGIDYSARLLIKMCLTNVANDIKDSAQDWFDLANSIEADTPTTHVVRILLDKPTLSEEEIEIEKIKKAIETLKERRQRLEGVLSMSEILKSSIDDDIRNMEKLLSKTSKD